MRWYPQFLLLPLLRTASSLARPSLSEAEHLAQSVFGVKGLKNAQRAVLAKLLEERSTLAVLPTGYGKSLCYQMAPLLFDKGLTVVVSPLLALMREQEERLRSLGLPARRIDSSLSAAEASQALSELRSGEARLVFVSPERFLQEKFSSALAAAPGGTKLLVVDEAHTISEWGPAFRPDYLKLRRPAKAADCVLALTATATPRVRGDVMERRNIADVISIPPRRENLLLCSRAAEPDLAERVALLARRLASRPPGDAIVYVRTRKDAEDVAEALHAASERLSAAAADERLGGDGGAAAAPPYEARSFHAGKGDEEKEATQRWFSGADDCVGERRMKVMCCTIAFGMGMDKPDVRYVYHLQLPQSLEAYSQEVGRAGRDGEASLCEAFLSPLDASPLQNHIHAEHMSPSSTELLVDLLLAPKNAAGAALDAVAGAEEARFTFGEAPSAADGLMDLEDALGSVQVLEDGERRLDLRRLSLLLDERDTLLKVALCKLEDWGLLEQRTPFFATAKVSLTAAGRRAGDAALLAIEESSSAAAAAVAALGPKAIADPAVLDAFRALRFASEAERTATAAALSGAIELRGRRKTAKIATVDVASVAAAVAAAGAAPAEPAVGLAAVSACEAAGFASKVELKEARSRVRMAAGAAAAAKALLLSDGAEEDAALAALRADGLRDCAAGVGDAALRAQIARRLSREAAEAVERDARRVFETLRLLSGGDAAAPAPIAAALDAYFDLPAADAALAEPPAAGAAAGEAAFFEGVLGDADYGVDVAEPPTATGVREALAGGAAAGGEAVLASGVLGELQDVVSEGLRATMGERACYESVEGEAVRGAWEDILAFARSPRGRWIGLDRDARRLARFAAGGMSPRTAALMRRKMEGELRPHGDYEGDVRDIAGALCRCDWADVLRLAEEAVAGAAETAA